MGKWLFVGAVMLLVAGIANAFLQSSALMITVAVLAIGIFSAFIQTPLHHARHLKGAQPKHFQTRR